MDKIDKRRKYDDAFKAEADAPSPRKPLNPRRQPAPSTLTPSVSTSGSARPRLHSGRPGGGGRNASVASHQSTTGAEVVDFKRSHRHLLHPTDPMSCWQFIEQERRGIPWTCSAGRWACRRPATTPGASRRGKPCPPPAGDWQEVMKQAFSDHRCCYGTRRLRAQLHVQGYRIGRQQLRTAMRRHGLRALQPRAYAPRTTDSTHGPRCAPNRLLDQPKPM